MQPRMASGIDSTGDMPEVMISAPTTVHSASTEPTDRSIPAVRITKVMPAANTVLMAIWTKIFSALFEVAK